MNGIAAVTLSDLLRVARRRKASDIHLSPRENPVLRVDGLLEFVDSPALSEADLRSIAATIVGDSEIERIEAGDDISQTFFDDEGLVRIHLFRVRDGIAVALRLLDRSIPTLESLYLPPVVATLAQRDRGLVIFAGPTGSGKSTSLAAIVDRINVSAARRILTIEDPIEYRHTAKRSSIVQREVGRDVPTFEKALLGALRADPDVIVVGEMRDRETMQATLNAAETGHLVFATLHTGDAVQTVERIVDTFAGAAQAQARAQLSQVLVGIVCQHLVVRSGGRGRRAVAEVLVANDAVRTLIRESRTHLLRNALLTGRSTGMQTLEHHLSDLLAAREITFESAAQISTRSEEIRNPTGVLE